MKVAIHTNYGDFDLSDDSIKYLNMLSDDWVELCGRNRPYKNKNKEKIRLEVVEFIEAVTIIQKARWRIGSLLTIL